MAETYQDLTEFQRQQVEEARQLYGDASAERWANKFRKKNELEGFEAQQAERRGQQKPPVQMPDQGEGADLRHDKEFKPTPRPELTEADIDLRPQFVAADPITSRPIDERQLIPAQQRAMEQRTQELIKEGYSLSDAKYLANQEISGIIEQPRGPKGEKIPGASERKVEELSGFEAIGEALKPQTIITKEAAKQRREMLSEARQLRKAQEDAIRKQLEGVPDTVSKEVIENAVDTGLVNWLNETKQGFRRQAELFLNENKDGTPTEEEIEALSTEYFEGFVDMAAPELKDRVAPKSGWEATKEAGGELIKDFLVKEDKETGEVKETLLSTVMRDVGGIWSVATVPIAQALTYEVDPETGERISEDDVGLFAATRTQEVPEYDIREGRRPATQTEAESWKPTDLWDAYSRDLATNIERGRFFGDDLMDIEWVRDTAVKAGVPTAPWWIGLGLEVALPLTPVGPAAKLTSKGLAAAGKATAKVGAKTAKAGARGVKIAEAAAETVAKDLGLTGKAADIAENAVAAGYGIPARQIKTTGEVVEAAGRGIEAAATPLKSAKRYAAQVRAREILKGEDVTDINKAADLHDVRRVTARRVAEVVTEPKSGGIIDLLERVSKQSDTIKEASEFANKIDEVANNAYKNSIDGKISDDMLTSEFLRNWVAVLLERNIIGLDEAAKAASGHSGAIDIITNYAQWLDDADTIRAAKKLTIEDFVSEKLLNEIPDDIFFLTPDTVVSKAAWKKDGKAVIDKTKDLMDGSFTEEGFKALNQRMLLREVLQGIGPAKLSKSKIWKTIGNKLAKGTALTEMEYSLLFDLVLSNNAKRIIGGAAQKLRMTGKAATRAEEPVVRRVGVFSAAKDIMDMADIVFPEVTKKVREFTEKGGIAFENISKTPIQLKNALTEISERSANLPKQLTSDLAKLQKEGYTPNDAFDKVLSDAYTEVDQGFVKSVLDIFFGGSHQLSGDEIKEILSIIGDTVSMDTFGQIIEVARRIKPRLKTRGVKTAYKNLDNYPAAATGIILEKRMQNMVSEVITNTVMNNPEIAIDLGTSLVSGISRGEFIASMNMFAKAKNLYDIISVERYIVTVNNIYDMLGKTSPQQMAKFIGNMYADEFTAGVGRTAFNNVPKALRKETQEFIAESFKKEPNSVEVIETTEALLELIFEPLIHSVSSSAAGWKVVSGLPDEQIISHLVPNLSEIRMAARKGETLAFFGDDVAEAIAEIEKATASGAFKKNLDRLRVEDPTTYNRAKRMLGSFVRGSRRTMISGMLSGFPLPNSRFLGMNILTAPLIAATTLSVPDALKSIGVGRLVDWTKARAGLLPDGVAFVDKNGKQWTRQMLDDAIARNNIGFSQVSFEFGDQVINDIVMRSKVGEAGNLRKRIQGFFGRELAPWNKNIWARFAEASDNFFRENVFVSALKAGKTEAEASKMAKETLLDYGKVPTQVRDYLGNAIVFVSFRYRMYIEFLMSLVRDPNNIRRMMLFNQQVNDRNDTWQMVPGYAQTRLYSYGLQEAEGVRGAIFGPSNPALEAAADIVGVLGWMVNGMPLSQAKEAILDEIVSPEGRLIKDLQDYGPDNQGAGYVPDRQVILLKNAGLFDEFQELFNVEPVYGKQRYPGSTTFREFSELERSGLSDKAVTYRFITKGDYNKYLLFQYALVRAGLQRNIDDIGKVMMAAGQLPPGTELKLSPTGAVYAVRVATGESTPIRLPTEYSAKLDRQRKLLRELRAMSRE